MERFTNEPCSYFVKNCKYRKCGTFGGHKVWCDVNWWVILVWRQGLSRSCMDTDEYKYRQCVHLLWWMKINLPNHQIKITIKCTTWLYGILPEQISRADCSVIILIQLIQLLLIIKTIIKLIIIMCYVQQKVSRNMEVCLTRHDSFKPVTFLMRLLITLWAVFFFQRKKNIRASMIVLLLMYTGY